MSIINPNANQVPGSNLLNMAFRIIAKQSITYYQYTGRALNDIGEDVTQYAPARQIPGSFQPVPRQLYESYGLDFQKSYFTFYTSNGLLDVQRDVSGDQIAFQGHRYQCESNNEWFGLDGWVGVLCVEIQDVVLDQLIWGFNEIVSYPTDLNSYVNFGNGNFAAEIVP